MHDKLAKRKRDNAIFCIVLYLRKFNSVNGEGGYSLMELVATIILIGVTFPALIGFITGSMTDTIKNEYISKAIILAGEKMEEICADKNELSRGIPYISAPNQYPSEVIDQFTRNVSVQSILFNNVPAIEVIVTVNHPGLSGPYTLNQIYTEYSGN